jgi:ParB/RepB/Spo0J family partition protein
MASKKLESIVEIPLKQIDANFSWNARSGDFTADSGGKDEEHNFEQLVESLKARGQDTPVTVRPKGRRFELTAGFRRYAALSRLAKENDNPNATIKAVVKSQSDVEARSENIRENTARDDLKGPDLAWALHQLYILQTEAGEKPTDSSLANEVGKSQPYVSKLMRIMLGVSTKITDQWRASKVAITVNDMASLVGKPKEEQTEEFKKLLEAKAGTASGAGAHSGNAWLDAAKKKAESLGTLFGRLEKLGKIDTTNLTFDNDLDLLMKVNGKANSRQRSQISKAAQKAYETAIDAEEPSEDESEEAAE